MDSMFEELPSEPVEIYAQTLFDSLQKLDTSADISLHLTCDGKAWYEWWIAGQYGMSPTFVDAVQEMYTRKLNEAA